MFFIVEISGKQYKVCVGDTLTVDKINGAEGDSVVLSKVLMVVDGELIHIGKPFLCNTVINTRILEQKKSPKIIVFKKNRRCGYRRKKGHRQMITVIKIDKILNLL